MNYNEKQLQIIEIAETLFAEKGFDGTSVRDIAEVAGINIAMISYYFGSKEKLMEALFELKTEKMQMRVESLLNDKTLTSFQKMDILIVEQIERMSQSQCFYKIMFSEQFINKNAFILQKVLALKVKNAELVGEIIKEGQNAGVFKKNIDVALMLNTLIGTGWQTFVSKDYYRRLNEADLLLSDEEYKEQLKTKLIIHIKTLFKAILSYDA